MKKIQFGTSDIQAAAVILGCMRLINAENPAKIIETAVENGINFFDHADIYGGGECETIFGQALKETGINREELFIQTKCGIRKGFFDFSKEHIVASVEGSLQRLGLDYVDALLLHRPDTLVEPEEVAAAFDQLETQGKVKYFGVSNQKPMQIELLKKTVKQPLMANQLQFGLKHTGMIDQGIHVNMTDEASAERDGSVLDYSRLNQMTIQAWSPYQYGFFEGVFIGNEKFPELNAALDKFAEKYNCTQTGLASAWILRHPANMQVIAGTMNKTRIKEIAAAADIVLSREDWYEIYRAAGNILP
ncbi:aldo/keto reductase family oxidoreductase [Enterococcus sp. UD-01]|uniref:aldo/keto reductase n=1 Tax=Enterococcus sp. UD-01 TaxID=3373911 RepID=UPI0038371819